MLIAPIPPVTSVFTDIDGQPLERGFIYIGVTDLDPKLNPINVYWDEAQTQLVQQPIRTLGGYPSNNGVISRIYTGPAYSILVTNKNNTILYQNPHVRDKSREIVSVMDFGAVGDGVTDDTAAIQAALDYANTASTATGRMVEVFFPAGKYYRPNNKGALRPRGRVRLRGAGRHASIIYNNDSVSAARSDLIYAGVADGLINFEMVDLGLQANWGVGDFTQRSHLCELYVTDTVFVSACHFADSRFMALVVSNAESVTITDCSFYRTAADGARATNCKGVTITNNTFDSVNDDCIAVHTKDSEAGPLDNFAVITGNRAVDSQGITVLGAKRTVIDGNVLVRPHTRGITVGTTISDPTEGNTAVVGVKISNNIIDTLFVGSTFFAGSGGWGGYIAVLCIPPTTNGSGYVGQQNGSGEVISPYPYFFTNDTDSSAPSIGNWFVQVHDNQCLRTLGPVAKYSDYGYGQRYARGGPVDPAITENTLGVTASQLVVTNHAQKLSIHNNLFMGAGASCILLDGTPSTAYISWQDVAITNNRFINWRTYGLQLEGVGTIRVEGNSFDGDPYHVSPQRVANGKWLNGTTMAAVRYESTQLKVLLLGNHFRNMQSLFNGAPSVSDNFWRNNLFYCNPAVEAGWNADNIGIGVMVTPERIGHLVVEDGDPASATHGQILNFCLASSTSMPTTGKYVVGHFVKNHAPLIAGTAGSRYTILGWTRNTNGTSHVLNTDWFEVRCLTGT